MADVSVRHSHADFVPNSGFDSESERVPMCADKKVTPDEQSAPIDRLLAIMARLRGPDGCPWDIEQDFASIAPYTIEEAYEVLDAINRKNMDDLRDELGDLLLQVVFHARMAEEANHFDFNDVATAISDKMISRHPHVFGAEQAGDPEAVKEIWEARKAAERQQRAEPALPPSVLDGVAQALPALMRAQKISKRAARTGFDWPEIDAVFDKLDEERDELREAIRQGAPQTDIEDELGDLLFVAVNLARSLDVDAETALRRANEKFSSRFRFIEQAIAATGKNINDADMDEMQAAWERAKQQERLKAVG